MKNSELQDALGDIDAELIRSAEGAGKKRRPGWLPAAAAAAVLLPAIVLLGLLIRPGKAPQTAENTPPETADPAGTEAGAATARPRATASGGDASIAADWVFEDSVDIAPVIFEGVCMEKTIYHAESIPRDDMIFHVDKVYRGDIEVGSSVNVLGNGLEAFSKGERYLMLTVPMASVYSGKELYYFSELSVAFSGGACFCILPDVADQRYETVIERLENRLAAVPVPKRSDFWSGDGELYGAYCTSEDLGEIVAYSDCAALVRVDNIYLNEGDRTCYNCTVISCPKGGASGSVRIIAFKNSMEIGGEYLLLLSKKPADDSYMMSSRRSVIAADSPEAEQVLELFR